MSEHSSSSGESPAGLALFFNRFPRREGEFAISAVPGDPSFPVATLLTARMGKELGMPGEDLIGAGVHLRHILDRGGRVIVFGRREGDQSMVYGVLTVYPVKKETLWLGQDDGDALFVRDLYIVPPRRSPATVAQAVRLVHDLARVYGTGLVVCQMRKESALLERLGRRVPLYEITEATT